MSGEKSTRLSRRGLLRSAVVFIGSTAVLAACQTAATPAPATPKPAEATPTTAAAKPATTPAAKPTTAPAAKAPAAGKTGEIQIATRGGSDGEIMEKSVVQFKEETGITAKHVSYGAQPEYWAKVQAMHATKQAADVIWASTGGLFALANKGILADLDPLIKADNYDLGDYIQTGLDSLKLNGKLYAMPWGGHAGEGTSVLYNIDLLAKAGFSLTEDCNSLDDWSFDKLTEAAIKTTVDTDNDGKIDEYGFAPATSFLSLTNTIGGFGGEFMSADGKSLTMDTPEFKSGLTLVSDWYSRHKVAPTPGPQLNTAELFATGKLAMLQTGYWGQFSPGEAAINGRFKWGMGLIPKGPAGKRGSSLTINGQTVWSGSQQQDAAWQFVKWLLEPKNHVPIVLSGGSRPSLRNSVLTNEQLMTQMKSHKCFVPYLQAAEPWKQPANFRWEEFNQTVVQVFANLYLGKESVDEAIANAKPKLQAVLDKPIAQ